jgi:hypothetical protein
MVSKKKRQASEKLPASKSKFQVLPNGLNEHTVKTPYGTIVYTYSPSMLNGILRGILTKLLGRIYYGAPIEFNRLIESAEDEPPYRLIFNIDEEFSTAKEKYSTTAMALLKEQAPELLIEASEQLILEVIFRTLTESEELPSPIINSKSSQLLQLLIQHINQRVKQRVNARTPGGRDPEWTPERREAFLAQYETALIVFRDAKRIYRQNKRLVCPQNTSAPPREKWDAMVSIAHPELPDDLIKQLRSQSKNAEPSQLALEYSARIFNVEANDYLKKVLTRARRTRRTKQDI